MIREMKESATNYEIIYLVRNAKHYNIDRFLNSLSQLNALLSERKKWAESINGQTDLDNVKEIFELNKHNICALLGIEV